jgi:hypothetical protein
VGQVEAVPEQLDRARLAVEPRREPPEHLVGRAQDAPPALDGVRVVAVVDGVLGEVGPVAEVERRRRHVDVDAHVAQRGGQVGVEPRAGHPVAQREARRAALARPDAEPVVDDVDLDLHGQVAVRHRPGGDAVGRHGERHVPPVVAEGHERHANLADHLREAVKRLLGRPPLVVGEGRPHGARGGCHRSVLR